jgi:hypothetical protein
VEIAHAPICRTCSPPRTCLGISTSFRARFLCRPVPNPRASVPVPTASVTIRNHFTDCTALGAGRQAAKVDKLNKADLLTPTKKKQKFWA